MQGRTKKATSLRTGGSPIQVTKESGSFFRRRGIVKEEEGRKEV